MSGKRVWLSGLAVALLGLGVARGQGPAYPSGAPTGPASAGPTNASADDAPLGAPPGAPAGSGPAGGQANGGPAGPGNAPLGEHKLWSTWINYPRSPGCCGPLGGNGPISSEVFLRTGVTFPLGSGIFGNALDPGWAIEGGARVLFYNKAVDRAWGGELSISNWNYNQVGPKHQVPLLNLPSRSTNAFGQTTTTILPELDVSVAGLNVTFANAALSREWYLIGSGDCGAGSINWRFGMDLGGRWGSGRVDLNEIRHRTSVFSAAYVAWHTDLEIPCSCCTLVAGVRGEYNYVFNDILQSQNDTDLQAINLLFTFGARY
jgi:hypothetical protein